MRPVFIDTNIFIYASGNPHPNKTPSKRILEKIALNHLAAAISTEVLQEILFRYCAVKPGFYNRFRGKWPKSLTGQGRRAKSPQAYPVRYAEDDFTSITQSWQRVRDILPKSYCKFRVKARERGLLLIDDCLKIIPAILPVSKQDILRGCEILKAYHSVEPRDAIHAAVMLNRGIEVIYSYDKHFSIIKEIKRVEP